MAVVAAHTVFALFQENWLDTRSISFKIESGGLMIAGLLWRRLGPGIGKR